MPARTRTNKLLKASKENVLNQKTKTSNSIITTRRLRKPLADKTTSASDDNASIEAKSTNKSSNAMKSSNALQSCAKENIRPRRDRRLPSRFNENKLLKNLSNSIQEDSPAKKSTKETLENVKDSSLVINRPKRIHRLPAKFGDHVISPIKSSVQPCHASTPILVKNKKSHDNIKDIDNPTREPMEEAAIKSKPTTPKTKVSNRKNPVRTRVKSKLDISKEQQNEPISKITRQNSDKNNNPNTNNLNKRNIPEKENNVIEISIKEKNKANYHANYSYKVLEEKKSVPIEEKLAIYEFTFDPSEEPAPQKKKRKRVIKKKPAPKLKNVFVSDKYNKKMNKTLESLTNIISTKTGGKSIEIAEVNNPVKVTDLQAHASEMPAPSTVPTLPADMIKDKSTPELEPVDAPNSLEQQDQCMDDFNYSPVMSPAIYHGVKLSNANETANLGHETIKKIDKPEELSFFDDIPVASSSMNVSTRNPNASPWRVEFNNLPIKWSTNTYVKPNMTPAVESSFVMDNSKKHVYTNILSDNNMPEIVNQSEKTNYKQSTLISFFKEVCEKKKKAVTPTKSNSIFNDSYNTTADPVQAESVVDNAVEDVPSPNVETPSKRKSSEMPCKTHKDITLNLDNCFGFDESTLNDQENISPNKKAKKPMRIMKTRSKVLREANDNVGPYRANIPLANEKEKQPRVILVAARIEEIPEIFVPEKETLEKDLFQKDIPQEEIEKVNYSDSSSEEEVEQERNMEKEGSPNVALFEDVDVVHYNKPIRKSYGGKAKKVAFNPVPEINPLNMGDSVDDLNDDSFHIPVIKERKPVKKKVDKKKMSTKEKKEVEKWAAGFNSMCEEVDEFDLVFE